MKTIKLEVKKFSEKILLMKGISKKTVEEHLKLYTGYINKYNEIQEKLSTLSEEDYGKANQVFSVIRELNVILPSVAESAPKIPKAVEEVVVVLKAMQKSFLLRGSVKEVKEEEQLEIKNRKPATAGEK